MRRIVFATLWLCSALTFAEGRLIDYVNPIIGTNGMGHTFPGACAPFGLVQLSPDTDTIPHNVGGKYQGKVYEYCAGYQHRDKTIVGFSHTHLSGTGHSDLGDILVMPTTGAIRTNPGTADNPDAGYRSRFSHQTERCSPGYYEVMLDDYGVRAQLTATQRVGVHKYTYPQQDGQLILDLGSGIYNYEGKTLWSCLRVVNDTLLTGYRVTNGWARQNYTYFAISFSQPIARYGYKDGQRMLYNGFWRKMDIYHNFPDMAAREIVAYFGFNLPATRELTVKVALSPVSMSGAVMNLRAEAEGKTFEQIRQQTAATWEDELRCYDVEGTADQKALFYTAVYHTMINPSVYMDVDGRYRGNDMEIHRADGFTNYTVFSLWDTYRAEHPLLNLMKPRQGADMVTSMVRIQQQSALHLLPIWYLMANEGWCMSGYHAVPVLADVAKKLGYPDKRELLAAMDATATSPWMEGLADYMRLGYVPYDRCGTSASNTLEYAYDDWTIYQTALDAGDTAMAQTYRQRALNYRNVFRSDLGLACPKYKDGSWKKDFSPLQTYGEGFIEGNSANYSFHVPHDVKGMIACFGGDSRFISRLDELFATPLDKKYYEHNEDIEEECLLGGYVHGNEPSHHVPYLYAWTSQPWKSQYWLREIMNRMYVNNIDGLHGNDDCGQMSAWYIFTAMGFYPVCPGTDQYVLGAPYVPSCRLTLANGKTFEVSAPGVSDKNRYVREVRLNGKVLDRLYITHAEVMAGGKLEFKMAASPNKKRSVRTGKPYSLSE
ncbi:MAG: glycoside hydrolase family 92 protein [Bacteroidaceae bacterium]|nr:glycoside hydrolase family 92 protein [Bacteroidaceae bacterium]